MKMCFSPSSFMYNSVIGKAKNKKPPQEKEIFSKAWHKLIFQ